MRIVLDTNILISALLWDGTPHHLLTAIRDRPDIRLYTRPALLEQFGDVLRRPFAEQRLAKIGKTAWQVMEDYAAFVETVEPAAVPRVVTSDADDDQVIAAAVEAGADLVVSGAGNIFCCSAPIEESRSLPRLTRSYSSGSHNLIAPTLQRGRVALAAPVP